MSFAPPRSIAAAPSTPSFTHEHWMLRMRPCSSSRAIACTAAVLEVGRARARQAGEVDRRVEVHERQRHELGEPAGLVLDAREQPQVRRPSARACRRGRTSSSPSSGAPAGARWSRPRPTSPPAACPWSAPSARRRRGSRPRCRAASRRRPRLPATSQSWIDRPVRAAPLTTSIGLNACTCSPGCRRFTSRGDVEVGRARQVGVDAALHADLGRADAPTASSARVADLVERQRVGVGVGAALRERAEPAAGVADVGEVDVAVDDVGHVVADGVATDVVGEARPARRPRRPAATSKSTSASASVIPAGSRSARRSAAATSGRTRWVGGLRGTALPRRRAGVVDGQRRPVAVRRVEVAAPLGPPALGVDRGVQVDPAAAGGAPAAVGLLPRQPRAAARSARASPRLVAQRGDVRRAAAGRATARRGTTGARSAARAA